VSANSDGDFVSLF